MESTLIVGLGNPGLTYRNNRHNVGFMAVDRISDRHSFLFTEKSKFKAFVANGLLNGRKVYLCKPQTYMNLSGESVQLLAHFYKISPQNIIVLHDEIDIGFGELRHKIGGGHAGHNGLRSIDKCIGTKEYHRIRIGVGRPDNKNIEVSDYVLSDFREDEQLVMDKLLDKIAENIGLLVENKLSEFKGRIK